MTSRTDRPQGRGIYIWQIDWMVKTFGSANQVANQIMAQGFDWIIWKVLEGRGTYQTIEDTIAVTRILQARGVKVWGYQYEYPGGARYLYKGTVKAQVEAAIEITHRMDLDGFVIDAESQMKHRPTEARAYASRLRAGLPKTPIALSTYRYPEVHPEFPWESYIPFIDLMMPQTYWQGSHNPAFQVNKTIEQYSRLVPQMDVVLIGSAYAEHGWKATPDDLHEFNAAVRSAGHAAEGYWEFMGAWNNGLMPTLAELPDFPGDTSPPVPPPDQAPEDWEEFKAWVRDHVSGLADLILVADLVIDKNARDIDQIKSWIRSFDND